MDGVNSTHERKCFQGILLSNHKLDGVMDGVNWACERKCFQGIFLINTKLDRVTPGLGHTNHHQRGGRRTPSAEKLNFFKANWCQTYTFWL